MEHASFLKAIDQWRSDIESVHVRDGHTAILPGSKATGISNGCEACKVGKWYCLFIGSRCNLNCSFCVRGHDTAKLADDPMKGVGGKHLAHVVTDKDVLAELERSSYLDGVSFSGGEPWMYLSRVTALSKEITRQFPKIYQWIYTNGTMVDWKRAEELHACGVQEIRFDAAASDFSPDVMKRMAVARKIFPIVTIETPVLPGSEEALLACLDLAAEIGIDYVNLHDIKLTKDLRMETPKPDEICSNPIMPAIKSWTKSTESVYRVMKAAASRGYPMSIHDCTYPNVVNQQKKFATNATGHQFD
ncbi:hypothetical protein BURK2_02923 [Burkholderiales bacterium]|nr:hypothetical protein BURK2_02923 [Burkholderiales bacterium]